jgi:hypothetical protein
VKKRIHKRKWTLEKINKMTEEFFNSAKSDEAMQILIISLTFDSMLSKYENKKLTLRELKQIITAFNKSECIKNSKRTRDAIKKYLILDTLLSSGSVANIKILFDTKEKFFHVYREPDVNFTNEPISRERDRIGKIAIYGVFENCYLGIPKITGKIRTGLCRCCRDYEIDKIEVKKILDIKDITKLAMKDNSLIITTA